MNFDETRLLKDDDEVSPKDNVQEIRPNTGAMRRVRRKQEKLRNLRQRDSAAAAEGKKQQERKNVNSTPKQESFPGDGEKNSCTTGFFDARRIRQLQADLAQSYRYGAEEEGGLRYKVKRLERLPSLHKQGSLEALEALAELATRNQVASTGGVQPIVLCKHPVFQSSPHRGAQSKCQSKAINDDKMSLVKLGCLIEGVRSRCIETDNVKISNAPRSLQRPRGNRSRSFGQFLFLILLGGFLLVWAHDEEDYLQNEYPLLYWQLASGLKACSETYHASLPILQDGMLHLTLIAYEVTVLLANAVHTSTILLTVQQASSSSSKRKNSNRTQSFEEALYDELQPNQTMPSGKKAFRRKNAPDLMDQWSRGILRTTSSATTQYELSNLTDGTVSPFRLNDKALGGENLKKDVRVFTNRSSYMTRGRTLPKFVGDKTISSNKPFVVSNTPNVSVASGLETKNACFPHFDFDSSRAGRPYERTALRNAAVQVPLLESRTQLIIPVEDISKDDDGSWLLDVNRSRSSFVEELSLVEVDELNLLDALVRSTRVQLGKMLRKAIKEFPMEHVEALIKEASVITKSGAFGETKI
jgi:hypothetical protein